jgi:hypothetical protein
MLGDLQRRAVELGIGYATRFLGHLKGEQRIDLFKTLIATSLTFSKMRCTAIVRPLSCSQAATRLRAAA